MRRVLATAAVLLGLALSGSAFAAHAPITTNAAQICGGSYRNSVYEIGSSAPTSAQSAFQ